MDLRLYHWKNSLINSGHSLAASPNGWIDSDAALAWIRDVLVPETQPAVPGDKRLLIMD